ncbi:MAG: 4-(cytidine 5'-diphospho)-2-C-methyl-D-erythritol kinase [Alphaproteobacteria bacterium]|nr:4-(cytidine 5'-diphospho)-2-C-methyl-D-erythritol kinase [Alphaproteobacteria bacterium]MBL6936267.1 4-(cytidine 5'-diphospho)-2-C-methyl-D-erythritol kinase [Alphaproteobacteria bacterium]MBL7098682.1 4-(cytidine 5'-diphospho)-2-C-methyl-D-erythritol kinase [Alphaproteobacteria bacterium]
MPSPTEPLSEFAPAKINLFLHVGERRADGFHDLESLVVFAGMGDALTLECAGMLSLEIGGPFGADLALDADNLVLRAARALAAHAGREPEAAIILTKNLPVASGIGGGSADAAAALRGLVRLWDLSVPDAELSAIAAALGSDVPVCLSGRASWMEGRGERVTAADGVPRVAAVLVNPRVAVPTGPVFKALKTRRGVGAVSHDLQARDVAGLVTYLKLTSNDLQAPAIEIAPVIGEVLNELSRMPGCLLWRMSGSGATCFGLFEDDDAAAMAAIALERSHPKWWVSATRFG